MKRHVWSIAVLTFLVATILGCGGGGGGTPPATVTVSGVAAKGPINGGTVKVFAVTGGAKGAQIGSGTTSTDGTGAYSVNIGSYTGPILIEVSGTYIDEVSGNTLTIAATAPLRAALANVTANVSAAVTPFTELAVQKAGTLTTTSIDSANNLVSTLFQVDIINTMPVNATVTPPSGASAAQINYGLALAAVSQYMSTNLQKFLTDFAITGNTLPIGQDALFRTAMSAFIANSTKNKTSVTDISKTPFVNVGSTVTTNLTASPTSALANGTDTITFTASFSPVLPDGTDIAFAITAGTAAFDNGSTTKTVKTASNSAAVAVKSSTPGNVTVVATYLPGSTASKAVTFTPVAVTAEVNIALSKAVSQLTILQFKVISNPVATFASSPTGGVQAAQGAGDPTSMVTVNYVSATSFNVIANTPFIKLIYNVTAGTRPGFTISPTAITNSTTGVYAATLNPDPTKPSIPLSPQLMPADFVLTVTYKDAAGNIIQ